VFRPSAALARGRGQAGPALLGFPSKPAPLWPKVRGLATGHSPVNGDPYPDTGLTCQRFCPGQGIHHIHHTSQHEAGPAPAAFSRRRLDRLRRQRGLLDFTPFKGEYASLRLPYTIQSLHQPQMRGEQASCRPEHRLRATAFQPHPYHRDCLRRLNTSSKLDVYTVLRNFLPWCFPRP